MLKKIVVIIILFIFFICFFKFLFGFLRIDYIKKISNKYKIDYLLVLSLIKEESSFNTKSVSRVGAIGLMQIMPKTGREIAWKLKMSFNEEMLFNPEINILFGIYYLNFLMSKYRNDLVLILSAYNAGLGIVDSWRIKNKNFGFDNIQFFSTKIFTKKVINNYLFLKKFKFILDRV